MNKAQKAAVILGAVGTILGAEKVSAQGMRLPPGAHGEGMIPTFLPDSNRIETFSWGTGGSGRRMGGGIAAYAGKNYASIAMDALGNPLYVEAGALAKLRDDLRASLSFGGQFAGRVKPVISGRWILAPDLKLTLAQTVEKGESPSFGAEGEKKQGKTTVGIQAAGKTGRGNFRRFGGSVGIGRGALDISFQEGAAGRKGALQATVGGRDWHIAGKVVFSRGNKPGFEVNVYRGFGLKPRERVANK